MTTINNTESRYDSINTETRRALVNLVVREHVSIRKASKILNIKYTTGKHLMSKYNKNGNIDRLKSIQHMNNNGNRQ